MTTNATPFPLDMDHVLAHPAECVVCRRKVSRKTLDSGRATMIPVTPEGYRSDRTGTFYNVVVGPECAARLEEIDRGQAAHDEVERLLAALDAVPRHIVHTFERSEFDGDRCADCGDARGATHHR